MVSISGSTVDNITLIVGNIIQVYLPTIFTDINIGRCILVIEVIMSTIIIVIIVVVILIIMIVIMMTICADVLANNILLIVMLVLQIRIISARAVHVFCHVAIISIVVVMHQVVLVTIARDYCCCRCLWLHYLRLLPLVELIVH